MVFYSYHFFIYTMSAIKSSFNRKKSQTQSLPIFYRIIMVFISIHGIGCIQEYQTFNYLSTASLCAFLYDYL